MFYILFQISEDAELLWRLARASRDVAQLSRTSEQEKKLLVYEALEYAKRALEKNESHFAAHKVSCLTKLLPCTERYIFYIFLLSLIYIGRTISLF